MRFHEIVEEEKGEVVSFTYDEAGMAEAVRLRQVEEENKTLSRKEKAFSLLDREGMDNLLRQMFMRYQRGGEEPSSDDFDSTEVELVEEFWEELAEARGLGTLDPYYGFQWKEEV